MIAITESPTPFTPWPDPRHGDVIQWEDKATGIVFCGLVMESARVCVLNGNRVGMLTFLGDTRNNAACKRLTIFTKVTINLER